VLDELNLPSRFLNLGINESWRMSVQQLDEKCDMSGMPWNSVEMP
jgi:hypothetical protein